jgi:hypothetical protein
MQIAGRTDAGDQCALGQEQEVDRLLLGLDVPADLVHVADQAQVRPHEGELALGIQRLAFGRDASSSFL